MNGATAAPAIDAMRRFVAATIVPVVGSPDGFASACTLFDVLAAIAVRSPDLFGAFAHRLAAERMGEQAAGADMDHVVDDLVRIFAHFALPVLAEVRP